MTLHVDFLWYPDCPSHDEARAMLLECLEEFGEEHNGFSFDVTEHCVDSEARARELAFPGSPTIRIEGADIDPQGAARNPVGLTCRVYSRPDGRLGPLPARSQLIQAISSNWEE